MGRSAPVNSSGEQKRFVSHLARVIASLPDRIRVMPAMQWVTWLRGNAAKFGIKSEEVQWTGLGEYLALRSQDKVSREDITHFLSLATVPLRTTDLLGPEWMRMDTGEATRDDAIARQWDAEGAPVVQGPSDLRFKKHVLPGGTNYRELLLSLPSPMQAYNHLVDRLRAKHGDGGLLHLPLTPEERFVLDQRMDQGENPVFVHAAHWDDRPNVLVHLRMDDRLDVEGKRVAMVLELQSDWGQQITKHGFSDQQRPWELFDPKNPEPVIERFATQDEAELAAQRAEAAGRFLDYANDRFRAPLGPFVGKTKAWVALGVKRALIDAVEGGYDRVAFISGAQAEAMFDVRKSVDLITYRKLSTDRYRVEAFKDGAWKLKRPSSSIDDIERHVGKGIAQMILAGEGVPNEDGSVSIHQNMMVGPQGLKPFYDEIVLQVASDVVRKLGGESLVAIDLDRSPLYQVTDDGVNFVVTGPDGTAERRVASLQTAEQVVKELGGGTTQWGFDITSALREKVLQGVAMFSHVEQLHEDEMQRATPQSVRDAIARLVRVSAEELHDNVGKLLITTSQDLLGEDDGDVLPTQTVAFQRWFDGSAVVDDDGAPLVVFHGTSASFSTFQPSEAGWYGSGMYFTDSAEVADEFAQNEDQGQQIMPVYLALKNPFYYDEPKFWSRDAGDEANFYLIRSLLDPEEAEVLIQQLREEDKPEAIRDQIQQVLQGLGHDGLIINSAVGTHREYVVFDPAAIKSAIGNVGTFNPDDPDITRSVAVVANSQPQAQAWHHHPTRTTVMLADRIPAGREQAVYLHEIVHSHGRDAMAPEEFGQLVDQVKAWNDRPQGSIEREIHDAALRRVATAGVQGVAADEELFAYAVEEAVARGVQPSAAAAAGSAQAWLQAVVESIQRIGEKLIGNDLQGLDGQDLVDLAYALAQLDSPEHGLRVRLELQEALRGSVPRSDNTDGGDYAPGQ
ncbi:hypothetical protein SAMN04489711_1362 [Paracidovorax wautersii]|uniref:ART-PolyVal-like domain-containing protein n=2 Tax=Paracidovorax wautersii TaxID=1177982 RepID=A0A1I2HUN8_9BURK|nr:hypothetical protein SAMN04489711_1362 [Paracidovorax wautersii]